MQLPGSLNAASEETKVEEKVCFYLTLHTFIVLVL